MLAVTNNVRLRESVSFFFTRGGLEAAVQLAITDSLLCFFRLERILEHDKFVRDELTLSMKKARINFFGDILPGASEICSKGNKHPEDGIRQE